MADGTLNVLGEAQDNLEPSAYKKFRAIISDAYAFVRSAEANAAIATVTIEELMSDQIKRNGESTGSNGSQYNPYSYDPKISAPASVEPLKPTNFLGCADTGLPTKMDQILAIQNELSNAIEEIKACEPVDIADPEEYIVQAQISTPEE